MAYLVDLFAFCAFLMWVQSYMKAAHAVWRNIHKVSCVLVYCKCILLSTTHFLQLYIIHTLFKSGIILFQFHSWIGALFVLFLVEIIEDPTCCLETLISKESEWGFVVLLVRLSEANAELFISVSFLWIPCVVNEKKVCENTFQAFTGKLDKPIASKFKGNDRSLESSTVFSSLNHE